MQVLKNDYFKAFLYVVIGLVLMYVMIYIFTPKPQIPDEYKSVIEYLNRTNADLLRKQRQNDSLIKVYQSKLDSIDYIIRNNKEKVTIIREYYHEIQKEINNYNSSQVDSFLKKRYKY